jgi:soluble lytic murein transglycosylase
VAGAPDGAWAAFLLGDILHDEGDLDGAAAAYERTVQRHPRSAYAGTALFRLGALAVLRERWDVASRRFDEYLQRSPGGNWYQASLYWKGRARSAAGDPGGALAAWQRALDYDPLGYYGLLASRALGVDAWASLRRSDAAPAPPPDTGDRALVGRMDDLRALGWRRRAVRELSARERRGETPAERLSLALLLNREGWTWQGTAIADGVRRARGGGWTDELLRAVYPLVYRPALLSAADGTGLDPALVAAIVRRESQFDRAVVSSAGAVGLMQVLPSTGAELARKEGIPDFRRSQLTVPEVNLVLGTSYLRELLDRNGGALAAALISYNAGPHRWARWRNYPEFRSDAELMVERIPFSETRVYVKTITAYREIYRRLWGLGAPVDAPADGS